QVSRTLSFSLDQFLGSRPAVALRPGIKTVLMSAHTDREFDFGNEESGITAFLRKPHRRGTLLDTLASVLDEEAHGTGA
ncbi:MAG: hypothetical protein VW644_12640, partial [Alphaproteobacteria bacterium]